MIYPHQQEAIDYITEKFKSDESILALLISGSIPHGLNNENSDIDFNVIVSNDVYEKRKESNELTYWESASDFYEGGYFDGKYITLDYLALIVEKGNEPSRFALQDVIIAFDRTGKVAGYINRIGTFDENDIQERTIRFLSQLDIWAWYCGEALKHNNAYLLDVTVSKLILFACRLILLENRMLFPYHKWLLAVTEKCVNKPHDLIPAINKLLKDKSKENIHYLYEMIKSYKDWSEGVKYNCSSYFLHDVETVWMRQDEFIENI